MTGFEKLRLALMVLIGVSVVPSVSLAANDAEFDQQMNVVITAQSASDDDWFVRCPDPFAPYTMALSTALTDIGNMRMHEKFFIPPGAVMERRNGERAIGTPGLANSQALPEAGFAWRRGIVHQPSPIDLQIELRACAFGNQLYVADASYSIQGPLGVFEVSQTQGFVSQAADDQAHYGFAFEALLFGEPVKGMAAHFPEPSSLPTDAWGSQHIYFRFAHPTLVHKSKAFQLNGDVIIDLRAWVVADQ